MYYVVQAWARMWSGVLWCLSKLPVWKEQDAAPTFPLGYGYAIDDTDE